MPILTPLWTIWGPTWSHLGPNFAHLEPNFVENSDRIAPNMPGRTRRPLQITIFLDFGPLQATIFNEFLVHFASISSAVLHTASDLRLVLSTPLGNDFHSSWYRSLHISHMFCTCFVRCFACLAPFRLIFSRIGWTSTWCCDGRLAKPAQSGAAPTGCCKP